MALYTYHHFLVDYILGRIFFPGDAIFRSIWPLNVLQWRFFDRFSCPTAFCGPHVPLEVLDRPLRRPQVSLGPLDERGTSVVGFNDEEMFVFWAFSFLAMQLSINFRPLGQPQTVFFRPPVLPEVLDRPPQRPQASLGLRGRLLIVRGVPNSTAISEFSTSNFFTSASYR